jgi:hypothetical protein
MKIFNQSFLILREKQAVADDHFHPWHAWFVTGNAYKNTAKPEIAIPHLFRN